MAVEIKPLTVTLHMQARGIHRHALAWYKDVAKERDMHEDDAWQAMTDYALFCVRVSVNGKNDDLGFALAQTTESTKDIRQKFNSFLDAPLSKMTALEAMIEAADSPADPDKAPGAQPTDPEVDGGGKSG